MEKTYYSDQPISRKDEDLYGRTSFAKSIVETLACFDEKENYIIGIYAKWGSGKTSTINLIKEILDNKKDFVVVTVDAWLLGGVSEKILWQILKEIHKKLTGGTIEKRISKFGKTLRKVSNAELPFSLDFELDMNGGGRKETKISSGKIVDSIDFIARLLESSDNIEAAKKKVSENIREKNKKAVVFIDNIDRLDKLQIVAVFRLLSTIADYAGITYILPFDKEYVCSAVQESLPDGQSGAEYIEKIIQIPINLPKITRTALDRVFTGKLGQLLDEYGVELDSEEVDRFKGLYYYYGINNYIQSPRNVNQVINALRFIIPTKREEVNIIDLVILELIRVFDEPFYEKIRANKKVLLGSSEFSSNSGREKRRGKVEKVFSADDTLTIAKQLFPFVNDLYSNSSSNDDDSLRKAQRVGSDYYFDAFFCSIDEIAGVSRRKILHLLNDSEDKRSIDKNLAIINIPNLEVALQIISDNNNLIKNRLAFCEALLDLAEREKALQQFSAPFSMNVFVRLLFTIDEILKESKEKLKDYTTLLEYNSDRDRIETIPYLIRQAVLYSAPSHTKHEVILNQRELGQYKKQALSIIREIAKNGKIPVNKTGEYALIYSYWADFGSKSETERYIKKYVKTADAAVDFISQFLGKWSSAGKTDFHRGDFDEAVYKTICKYLNPDYLYRLIVKDKKYSQYKDIERKSLETFDNLWDKEAVALSRVGNEHMEDFRKIVAQRFIFMHEHSDQEKITKE